MVEIQCPADCSYLVTAREHPAAVVVRQQQRDLALMMQVMQDFDERQSQFFFLLSTFLAAYRPAELHPLIDADVVDAASAMAATLETAARGVIYEHRPASLAAERLMTALKPVIAEAGGGRSSFERDAAVVLRRVEEAARLAREGDRQNRRALLDAISRVIRKPDDSTERERQEAPRLILP